MFHCIDFTQFCPLGSFTSMLLGMLMAFLSLFLILLVLLQRGRGGGLAGALGGAGGQSAFGSKAGDTFTVLTVSLAGIWIFVCAFAMWQLGPHHGSAVSLESDITAGPSDDPAEDASSGLVIPTSADQDNSGDNAALVPSDAETATPTDLENAVEPSGPTELNEAAAPTDAAASTDAGTPEAASSPAEPAPAAEAPAAETPAE